MSFKSKLTVALAAACCALALSVGAAKADTFTTFDVSGTFAGGAGEHCPELLPSILLNLLSLRLMFLLQM